MFAWLFFPRWSSESRMTNWPIKPTFPFSTFPISPQSNKPRTLGLFQRRRSVWSQAFAELLRAYMLQDEKINTPGCSSSHRRIMRLTQKTSHGNSEVRAPFSAAQETIISFCKLCPCMRTLPWINGRALEGKMRCICNSCFFTFTLCAESRSLTDSVNNYTF